MHTVAYRIIIIKAVEQAIFNCFNVHNYFNHTLIITLMHVLYVFQRHN